MHRAIFQPSLVFSIIVALAGCAGMGDFKPSQDLVRKTDGLRTIQQRLTTQCSGQTRGALTPECESLLAEYERARDDHRTVLTREQEKERDWQADKKANNNMMMSMMGGMAALSGMIGGRASTPTVSPQAMMMLENNNASAQSSALDEYEVAEQNVIGPSQASSERVAAGGAVYSGTRANSGSSSADPNTCKAGPVCLEIGKRAEPYLLKMNQRLSGNGGGGARAAEAGALAYCVQMVAAETSNACGEELEKAGDHFCADLAYQQRDALLESADGAKHASMGMSTAKYPELPDGGFDQICEW